MNYKLAECVGLWLAEGDNKTTTEITFTNNCWTLVKLFYETVITKYAGNPRIYVYSPKKLQGINLDKCIINYYTDKRARKPYYILRLASVEAVKDWSNIVLCALNNTNLYSNILRGFFAGEGNVKSGAHSNKALRIAQRIQKKFIGRLLRSSGISYSYAENERNYVITGKWNWDKFAKLKLADLHPDKKEKFWKLYANFKEDHYPALYLKSKVSNLLDSPKTANELSKLLNRSQARICDVLMELKKEGDVQNFRIKSKNYWTDQDIIIISKIKADYLQLLNKGFTKTYEFAKKLNVNWKSANRRLKELEKLGLVKFDASGWRAIAKTNVVVI